VRGERMITMDKAYKTKGGQDVRIISLDGPEQLPVVGIINERAVQTWTRDGFFHSNKRDSDHDLVEVQPTMDFYVCIWMEFQTMSCVNHHTYEEAFDHGTQMNVPFKVVKFTYDPNKGEG
jgi:hypothetical protein